MSNLEASQRTYFDMTGFCYSYKEFDGSPTDTTQQKDAQEFLNEFLDRLSN